MSENHDNVYKSPLGDLGVGIENQLKLVIEIDGGIHQQPEQKEYDINREEALKRWDVKIVRFTNEEVERDLKKVKKEIIDICQDRITEIRKIVDKK